jgi:hypothetical protein
VRTVIEFDRAAYYRTHKPRRNPRPLRWAHLQEMAQHAEKTAPWYFVNGPKVDLPFANAQSFGASLLRFARWARQVPRA